MGSSGSTSVMASSPLSLNTLSGCRRLHLLGARQVALHLLEAGVVLAGQREARATVALIGGGPEGPLWIGEMRARQAAKVGAAGGQDRIHMVDFKNIADRHGRNPKLVPDPVRIGRLEHA